MTQIELSLAILGLLLTPGPTNTLLFVAGAERGWLRAWRLIPAEVAGYALTVVPLTLAGGAILDHAPALRPAIAILAGARVAWLALRLWFGAQTGDGVEKGSVDAGRVFVTTMLNPKALIFGLVLLPGAGNLLAGLADFLLQVVVVAALWSGLGAAIAGLSSAARLLSGLRRAASIWLAVVAITLLARGFGIWA